MKTLIVIPAYNEKDNIERVVDNLIQNYPQYDYVVVNDGSTDITGDICRIRGYELIDLPVNLGLAGGFQAGLRYARSRGYDAVLQFDADGQHLPEYIAPMIKCMEKTNCDIVIGSRFVTVKKPKSLRMVGSYLISWAMRLTTGKKICDPTSGMRLFNRRMIKEFALDANFAPEPDTISFLLKNGATIREVQVEMAERIAGESYLNLKNAAKYMFKMGISIVLIQWFRKRKEIN
ncbi:MAG: glycosyltransferase family 2 protein [Oscillospiraceae bacterium]|nr:glycosyltransferase family 2 protein [Oscillospiraceae bacterium]